MDKVLKDVDLDDVAGGMKNIEVAKATTRQTTTDKDNAPASTSLQYGPNFGARPNALPSVD